MMIKENETEGNIKIDFDPRSHSYHLNGKKMDSVTQILKDEGFIDDRWYKLSGTVRGTSVHQGADAIDSGHMTAEDFYGQEIYMYLKAWEQFLLDSKLKITHIELPVGSKRYQYCGTLDRLASNDKRIWLIDIKSGKSELWHGLQLAAYAQAVEETLGIEVSNRRIVSLKGNGKYSVENGHKEIGMYDMQTWDEIWITLVKSRMYKRRWGRKGKQ
jgi:hypothetical protein